MKSFCAVKFVTPRIEAMHAVRDSAKKKILDSIEFIAEKLSDLSECFRNIK
jgi:hypothetical protein